MNDYLASVILGIVEGLTEFLPVSSTAHLRLLEPWLDISLKDPYWKMYTVVIQLGAILSVVVYFWGRILQFCHSYPRGESGTKRWFNHPLALTMLAFVVTAGPAFLLTKKIEDNLESPYVMGGALLVGGIIMWVVDVLFTRPTVPRMEDMKVIDAVGIGIAQIFSAVFPGTSRSMSTIASGQIFGLSRTAALEFSFFVCIPTMMAATLYSLLKFVRGKEGQVPMDAHRWVILAIGFVISFVVALVVIKWFMNWVRTRGFVPFAVYRIILGIIVVALAMKGILHA